MRHATFLILVVLIAACSSAGQDAQTVKLPERCLHRKAIHHSFPMGPFHFRDGESYKGAPIVKYEINEDGTVSDVKIKRSSGVNDIDRKAVRALFRWKYEQGNGCGIIETEMSVTIDWQ